MGDVGYGGSVDWKKRSESRYETILELNKRIDVLEVDLKAALIREGKLQAQVDAIRDIEHECFAPCGKAQMSCLVDWCLSCKIEEAIKGDGDG